jgi:hypothetical protein
MCKHNYAKLHPAENCVVCFYDTLGTLTKQEVMEKWKNATSKDD